MEFLSLKNRWQTLQKQLALTASKDFSLEALLMLIGIQETNDFKEDYSKEEKQNLIHVGTCTVLSQSGYFLQTHIDSDGWPHFRKEKNLPVMSLKEQELFLKEHILLFFEQHFQHQI